jgi:UrcA family protein
MPGQQEKIIMNSQVKSGRGTRLMLLSAGLALSLGTATAANAGSEINVNARSYSETRTAIVHVADLNLADARAQRTLDKRLSVALEEVCAKSAMYGVKASADYKRCHAAALAEAQSQLRQGNMLASNGAIRIAAR